MDINSKIKDDDNKKIEAILKMEHLDIEGLWLLATLKINKIIEFLENHRDFYTKKGIAPYNIVHELDTEKQIQIVQNLSKIKIPPNEKKEILVILSEETKKQIDISKIPEEYKRTLTVPITEYGNIIFDLQREPEDYRGLDRLFDDIEPEKFNEEERTKFIKFCEICPNVQVRNFAVRRELISTCEEYKNAEEWINELVSSINPNYSQIQKLAIIDNAIGNKISYSPDYETEVENINDQQALWKVVSSGYGSCLGIASAEQYILLRVGIDCQLLWSKRHAFLEVKDIELPCNGKIICGNTILDPTHNLIQQKFGARPGCFCISYNEARELDRTILEKDSHKCERDEKLKNETIGLSDENLRSIFSSVGLADEKGHFPYAEMEEKSNKLKQLYPDNPEPQLEILKKYCPNFSLCQVESKMVLRDILLDDLSLEKCVVDRVYKRTDKNKRPVLYVYVDSGRVGRTFYVADQETNRFIKLTKSEFTEEFECYERDLEAQKGIRPWDDVGPGEGRRKDEEYEK